MIHLEQRVLRRNWRASLNAILAAQASRSARLVVADDILLNASDLAALDAAVGRLHGFYRELAARGDLGRPGVRLPIPSRRS